MPAINVVKSIAMTTVRRAVREISTRRTTIRATIAGDLTLAIEPKLFRNEEHGANFIAMTELLRTCPTIEHSEPIALSAGAKAGLLALRARLQKQERESWYVR